MTQAKNEIFIEGILLETKINKGENRDNKEYISGEIKVQVDQKISDQMITSIIPIRMFAMRKTTKGEDNKAYDNILKLTTDFVSAATAGSLEGADGIRVSVGKKGSMGSISENLYCPSGSDKIVSTIELSSNFFDKVARASLQPVATFSTNIVVKSIKEEVKGDEVTGALILTGAIVQYNDRLDMVNFHVKSEAAKNHISARYNAGQTVNIQGYINYTSNTTFVEEEAGFGDPVFTPRTTYTRELVVTSGSIDPFDEERAYKTDDLNKSVAERLGRIEEKKKGATAPKKAVPAENTGF